MCVAVPGRIIEIREGNTGPTGGNVGTVDFQGTRIEVGLVFTPEAREGDWVLVHAGFALNVLDEEDARETWQYLKMAKVVDEIPIQLEQPADKTL